MDVARIESAEAEITRFIEKRSRKGEQDPDEQGALWGASVKAYNAREERAIVVRRYLFERHMERIHGGLSQEHGENAERARLKLEHMDKAEENGHRGEL